MLDLHVLEVEHPVHVLSEAIGFFRDVLHMPIRAQGEGFALFDNGSVAIRLTEGRSGGASLPLVLAVRDGDAAAEALLGQPGIAPLSPPTWVSAIRVEARLAAPHAV